MVQAFHEDIVDIDMLFLRQLFQVLLDVKLVLVKGSGCIYHPIELVRIALLEGFGG